MKKKVLLIEFNDFHEEVLLSQIDYFKDDKEIEVFLYINEKLKNKINFDNLTYTVLYIDSKNRLSKFLSIFKIINLIRQEKINYIIFNTFESKYIKILSKVLKNEKKFFIVHNLDFFSFKDIKNSKFLVLSKNLYTYAKKHYKNYDFDYFYPLIKDNKKDIHTSLNTKVKIVVPGLIEFSRRDYLGLLNSLKDIQIDIIDKLEFILLGNIEKSDGPAVMRKIEEYKLEKIVKTFKGFVPYNKYFKIIKESDLIMPLIHPNVDNFKKYHSTKITAAFNMAFSFKKPLLIYESFRYLEEFKNFSIFYNTNNLNKTIKSLNLDIINEIKFKMETNYEISWLYQKDKYRRIIFG